MLFTKFADWAYEDEIRVTVKLDQSTRTSGMLFKDFDESLKLAEVILGIRSETCRRELESEGDTSHGDVAIIRGKAAATDRFAIVPGDDAVRNHDDLTYYLRRGNVIHPVRFYREPEPMG